MEYSGWIRGFGAYTEAQMEQMKQDLEIAMPMPLLQYCAAYYQSIKRDPGIEELKLWDRFSSVLGSSPDAVAPMELLANDSFVAETYADLIEKRRALLPNAQVTPCTLAEATRIATAYLARAGKDMALNGVKVLSEVGEPLFSFPDEACVTAPDSPVQFRLLPQNDKTPTSGDWLVLLTSPEKQSRERYQLAVSTFLGYRGIAENLIASKIVDNTGLLHAVLSVTNGVWMELSRLSRVEEPIPLKLLTKGYEGDRLIRVPSAAADLTVKAAKACGIRACVFGRVTDDQKLRITNHQTPEILVDTRFVRSLLPLRGIRINLENEGAPESLRILHATKEEDRRRYLCADKETPADGGVTLGTVHAAASSAPVDKPFLHTLYTALTPVLDLAVAGCDHTMQRLAVSMGCPKDMIQNKSSGQLLSAILGIYRVQTELGIPTVTAPVLYNSELDHPEISVVSFSKGTPCPKRFMRDGSRVYLMPIELQANGLPGFANLRKDLEFLADLRRRGVLYSARVLCGESLTDGLRAMTNSGLTCRVRNSKLISEGAQTLALLLETGVGIPAIPVGGVVTDKAERQQTAAQELPPRATPLVWSETPEVVILSASKDYEARRLAAALLKKGANVHCFEDQATEAYQLSRAILGSQTLILCGHARIPRTPQVIFAVETLKNAGGYVISVGGNNDQNATFFFPDGFSEENLTEICKF